MKLTELVDVDELRSRDVNLRVEYDVKNSNWKAYLTRVTVEHKPLLGVGLTTGAAMDSLCNRIRGLKLVIDENYKDSVTFQVPMNLTV